MPEGKRFFFFTFYKRGIFATSLVNFFFRNFSSSSAQEIVFPLKKLKNKIA